MKRLTDSGVAMDRRTFLNSVAAAPAVGLLRPPNAPAALPKAVASLPGAKVTRVRIYRPPNFNPLFNQSNMLVTVETEPERCIASRWRI